VAIARQQKIRPLTIGKCRPRAARRRRQGPQARQRVGATRRAL